MRQRAEDLGRVLVLVEALSEHELFSEKWWSRAKDAEEWFFSQTKDEQADVIHDIAYSIRDIDEKLSEIICICRGHDELSENTESWSLNSLKQFEKVLLDIIQRIDKK